MGDSDSGENDSVRVFDTVPAGLQEVAAQEETVRNRSSLNMTSRSIRMNDSVGASVALGIEGVVDPMRSERHRKRRRRRLSASLLYLTIFQPVAAFMKPSLHPRRHNLPTPSVRKFDQNPRGTPLFSLNPPVPQSPHVAVALDQPLIPTDGLLFPKGPANRLSPALIAKSLLSMINSNSIVGLAAVALGTALILSIAMRTTGQFGENLKRFFSNVTMRVESVVDSIRGVKSQEGTPVSFDEAENEGWGVCTLRSKRRLGKSSYVRYDFDLPDPDNVLSLELGQQLSMCCLDNGSNVVRGDFHPYQPERNARTGGFSILAPNRTPQQNDIAVGEETASFVRVMKEEMKVGDEVAIKPGSKRLNYRGQYLPVTDMVYIAFGVGVVPVLDQVRTVLPTGSSSVKSVEVAWINEETKDFDVNADLLEKEYFKYSSKMAVSCIVEDVSSISMHDSVEINSAVPDFKQGTMAVVAGPSAFTEKTVDFLEERGYPKDTICVL